MTDSQCLLVIRDLVLSAHKNSQNWELVLRLEQIAGRLAQQEAERELSKP